MDEDAVKSSGLNTTKLKLFAFMVSAFVAGVGGALYIHYLGSIAPRGIFDINFLFTILIAALLGGASTIIGPIIGPTFAGMVAESYGWRWAFLMLLPSLPSESRVV